MSNPHDRLVKAVFGDPRYLVQHLRRQLPKALLRTLDLSRIRRVDRSFVDEQLSERHADLLFAIALKGGGEAFVYLLFEHQSTSDPLMPFRLLGYMLRIWERYLADHPGAKRLPLVYPMVLYNGEARWRAPLDLADLIDLPADASEALSAALPHLTYDLLDLSQVDDDTLTDGAAVALFQLLLKHHAKGDLMERLSAWRQTLERASAEGGSRAIELVIRYILEVHARPGHVNALRQLAAEVLGEDAEELVMTTAEQLRAEGRQRGLELGREEGRQEGRRHEAERLLLHMLRIRFDEPTAEQRAQISAAELSTLERWMGGIFAAKSVADVLAP